MAQPFRTWANPIRLSGLLGLGLLALPGSLAGFALLLSYAGRPLPVPSVSADMHARLQLLGFFLMLIWGFLVHGLPGMLGADPKKTRHVRWWMLLLAAGLALQWAAAFFSLGGAWEAAARVATGAAVLGGSAVLVTASLRGTHDWKELPFPMLVVSLAVPPIALGLYEWGATATASWLLVRGAIVPIVVAMGFRLFSAMARLPYPRERAFAVASLAWALAALGGALPLAWVQLPAALAAFAAMIGFIYSMGVWEPRRRIAIDRGQPAADFSVVAHIRIAFGFAVLGLGLNAALAAGLLADSAYYWNDVARHALTIGFALLVVMGFTQRIFPTFLRGRPASAGWMNVNLVLVTLGVLLRTGEAFLPEASRIVSLSAYLTYAGIVSYAAHMLRGMLMPGPPRRPLAPIKVTPR